MNINKSKPKATPPHKEQLDVSILGRKFTLLCNPNEKAALLATVALVDKKMHKIAEQQSINGFDKMAIFAALQIANDLLNINLQNSTNLEVVERINYMTQSIDHVLENPNNNLF